MTRYREPVWLQGLLGGELTPQVPVAQVRGYGDVHRGSPAIAELACVAALSGRSASDDVHVFDPTVGQGVMLETVTRALRASGSVVQATGLDINAEIIEEGQRAPRASDESWSLRTGNVLTDDLVPNSFAELVVSEPPWGVDYRALGPVIRERAAQGWYPQGLGQGNDAGWLFLQRGIAAMRSREQGGSRFVTFVNPAMLRDVPGRTCRNWLIKNDLLEALVRLPVGMAEHTEIPLYLLLLRTDKPASLQGRAHVIDLRGYMTTRDKGARRRISTEGLRLFWSALATRRSGPSNRIVPLDAFRRQMVSVSPGADSSVTFRTEVASEDPGGDIQSRYGPVSVEWAEAGPIFVSFDVERFFAPPISEPMPGVEYTRMAALLTAPPMVHAPARGAETTSDVIWFPTGQGPVTTTTPASPRGRVLRLHVNPDIAHPEYLAGWLNSDEGALATQNALTRAASGHVINAVRSDPASLWRLMDELPVPIRSGQEQLQIAESLLTLRRVETLVQAARADLWSGDKAADLIVSPFEPLLDESLERWTTSLPYPFATALWTLTSRNSIEARHRQIFHTWESYAAFLATVLLSALRQDSGLAEVESAGLRRALDEHGLSLERTSFGAWAVVIQRLGAVFRRLLSDDEDDRARLTQLFGGAPPAVIEAIVRPAAVQLISDVNAKRNAWLGHGGAASEAVLQSQVDYLMAALEELRSIVGEAWTRVPLVRAGKATSRQGTIRQEVELVMGTNVPFRPAVLEVGSIMDEGELYVATKGCVQPLPLSHLVVLRSAPESEQFACYFFNRADADNVRMVSYQTTESGEINEPRSEFAEDLGWLWVP